jgi:hypothetical protein
MDATLWVLVVLLVIVGVAVVGFVLGGRRSGPDRRELKQRFGPEYDREVERRGDRKAAEQRLAEVAERRDSLDIRDLTPDERERRSREWRDVQAQFVDAPAEAVASADALLTEVLRTRGYPIEDFDDRASLVSADHPHVVENYRLAHEAHERHRTSGAADTEHLRQAFVHYRALFDEVVGTSRPEVGR